MIGVKPSDSHLREAIEIRCSLVFPAMNIANALGGSGESVPWKLIRGHKLADLLAEAVRRGLDVSAWKTSVQKDTLTESDGYKQAAEKIDRITRTGAVLTDDGWVLDGVCVGKDVATALEGING